MSARTFVDTNVLIYAHDIDAKSKHEAAKSVLRELWVERSGALSTQVLQEFYVKRHPQDSAPNIQRVGASDSKQLCYLVHRYHTLRNLDCMSNRG